MRVFEERKLEKEHCSPADAELWNLETEGKALEFHYLDSWTTTKTTQRFPGPQNNARENLSKKRKEFDPFSFLLLFCFCFFLVVLFTRTQVPTICFLSWLRILTPSNEKILPRSHDHAHLHTAANQKTKNSLSQFYIT
jgi:predicted ATP-dependent protease